MDKERGNMINVGDTFTIDENTTARNTVQNEFFSTWKSLMDNNEGEWTVLEADNEDVATSVNRYTSRATRLNAYDYTVGYEFRAIRRTPNAYFLGRKLR